MQPYRVLWGAIICGFIVTSLSTAPTIAQEPTPGSVLQPERLSELLQLREDELAACRTDLTQCTDTLTLCRRQCGNGVADFQEECDGRDRRSATCDSVTEGARPYGTLGCNADCTWDTSGCTTQRFVDNKNGTITDHETGLMWEQKGEAPKSRFRHRGRVPRFSEGRDPCLDAVHGLDAVCTWFQTTNEWIAHLNAEWFAGYNDWRVPTVQELVTILDYQRESPPALDPIFATAQADGYWSATSVAFSRTHAWGVDYMTGRVFYAHKSLTGHVRAVRGGS